MDPSTEQLIRDYLNRLAVAARSSMGTDEVRVFLLRMRDSIERQCAAYGGPSTAEVSSALAAMGEPKALVAREHARLAAARARLEAATPHAAGSPATAKVPATETAAATDSATGGPGADPVPARTASRRPVQRRSVTARRKPAELLTGRPLASKNAVRPRGPQGRDSPVLLPLKRNTATRQDPPDDPEPWRAVQPDPAEQPGTALAFVLEPPHDTQSNVVAPPKFQPARAPVSWLASSPGRKRGPEPGTELGSARGAGAVPEPDPGDGPEQRAGAVPEPDPGDGPERRAGAVPEPDAEPGPRPGPGGGPGRRPARRPGPVPAGRPGDGLPRRRAVTRTASSKMASGGPESSRRERVATGLGVFIQRAPGLARQHPLECAAVILLGLGGLIYPPVWLLGALAALPSRLWDVKDKLTGLATPAVVAIVGGAGLAMGSHTSGGAYFRAALIIGGYLIRAGSVLGAGYLAWRVQRGPRQPAEPPWRRQYR